MEPTGEEQPRVIEAVVIEHEIRGSIYDLGFGHVDGYEWRLLLRIPCGPDIPARTEWTDWMFAPHSRFVEILASWQEYMTTYGHLVKKIPPGESAH